MDDGAGPIGPPHIHDRHRDTVLHSSRVRPTTYATGGAACARAGDARRAQPRCAGRHNRREHPLSQQSRGLCRRSGRDARCSLICSSISGTATPCRCCRNRRPPALACASGTCPAAMTKRCSHASAEIGSSVVGFEAAHVTVSKHDWWRKTVEARRSGADVSLNRAGRRAGASDQGRGGDRRRCGRLRGDCQMSPTRHLQASRAGVSERHVAGVIESAMRAAGYERVAFDTIVGSGPNAALPHYRAGDRILAAGDLVVLDFGGVLDGYCCDLTRTVSIGPPSAEARQLYARRLRRAAGRPRCRAAGRRDLGSGRCGARRARGRVAWARRSATAPATDSASMFTKSPASPGRVPTCRRCRSRRAWSLPSNQALTSPASAACGSRTTCW